MDDNCPLVAGTSTLGGVLRTDGDEDGYADAIDTFPVDETQWSDLDEDGYGDNLDGTQGDAQPRPAGDVHEGPFRRADSDSDGWSNANDAFLRTTPSTSIRTVKNGDAAVGFQPDARPATAGTSTQDRFGCLDGDGDGWSDANDAFPESTQHADSDNDGYGDNAEGAEPDACPSTAGTPTETLFGCVDGDSDGWADSMDLPNDERLWSDTDQDGYANQPDTELTDACLKTTGRRRKTLGCRTPTVMVGRTSGRLPRRRHQARASLLSEPIVFIGGPVVLVVLLVLLMIGRRRGPTAALPTLPLEPQHPTVAPASPAGPPLPPEGLPPGWTMEQWAWYGEDYLKNR